MRNSRMNKLFHKIQSVPYARRSNVIRRNSIVPARVLIQHDDRSDEVTVSTTVDRVIDCSAASSNNQPIDPDLQLNIESSELLNQFPVENFAADSEEECSENERENVRENRDEEVLQFLPSNNTIDHSESCDASNYSSQDDDSDNSSFPNEHGDRSDFDGSNEWQDFKFSKSDRLHMNLTITKAEVMVMLLHIYIRHNLTNVAVQDILNMINLIVGFESLPASFYKFSSYFSGEKLDRHFVCKNCGLYLGTNDNEVCSVCQGHKRSSFVMIDFVSQLKEVLRRNWDSIMRYRSRVVKAGLISDIMDGKIIQACADTTAIFLSFNTDGVSVFNSNIKKSLWPIIVTVNNLPPALRFLRRNIIVAGMWLAPGEPDLNVLLKPFYDDVNKLAADGLTLHNDLVCSIKISCCSVDTVARSKLQQIKQYNGYDACSFCDHPGSLVNGQIRYKSVKNLSARQNADVIKAMAVCNARGEVINGVKGISSLVAIPGFNIVEYCPVDYMHAVLLGVCKQMCKLWFENACADYYIKSRIDEIDSILLSINPFYEISRYPRKLSERKTWKANEWQNWLLIYAPVCLKGILPTIHYDNFITLSKTIKTLLRTDLTLDVISECEQNLTNFVSKFEHLYGADQMTYNVHLLLHISECVRNYGPLWTFSLFTYEDMNGMLKKFIKGPKEPVLQIANKYVMSQLRYKPEYLEHCQDKVKFFCQFNERKEEKLEPFELPDGVHNPYLITCFYSIKTLKYNRYTFKVSKVLDQSRSSQPSCDSIFCIAIDCIDTYGKIKHILWDGSDYYFLYFSIEIDCYEEFPLSGKLDDSSPKLMKLNVNVRKCVEIITTDKRFFCSVDFIPWVD